MNLRQLETFYWAAILGSFSAAANRLNATQSAVSMRIKELESNLGVALFDRTKRRAKVSKRGRDLIPYAEQLLRISSEMRDAISDPEITGGNIRIGVTEMVSLTWLPEFIRSLHNRYPKVSFELDESLTEDLVQSFQIGALDIILVPGRIRGDNILVHSLGTVDFQWMISPKLGDISNAVAPSELQNWPIIALSEQSFHFSRLKSWFATGHSNFKNDYTCKTIGVAYSLTKDGLGVSLLPVEFYREELASGSLRIIKTVPQMPAIEFFVICQDQAINAVIKSVATIAQEVSRFKKIK